MHAPVRLLAIVLLASAGLAPAMAGPQTEVPIGSPAPGPLVTATGVQSGAADAPPLVPAHVELEPGGALAEAARAVKGLVEVIAGILLVAFVFVTVWVGLLGLGAIVEGAPAGRDRLDRIGERIDAAPLRGLITGVLVALATGLAAAALAQVHLPLLGVLVVAAALHGVALGLAARVDALGRRLWPGPEVRPVVRRGAATALFLAASLLPVCGQVLFILASLQGLGAVVAMAVAPHVAGPTVAPAAPPTPGTAAA